MSRRTGFFLFLGIFGCLVLIALGVWQVQRLHWKQGVLAEIGARIEAAPVPLPEMPSEARDEYLAVSVTGNLLGAPLHVLTSQKPEGPGFRVISALETGDGRRVMADLGYIPEAAKPAAADSGEIAVTGVLLWPDETDSFTPAPNLERNMWFARDVPAMAAALGTEPVLIVVRATEPALTPRPLPVSIDIANDHFGYAVTWFSLALVWGLMTVYALSRKKRRIG